MGIVEYIGHPTVWLQRAPSALAESVWRIPGNSEQVRVFHDASQGGVSTTQTADSISLTVATAPASFVSLAIHPSDGLRDALEPRHILSLEGRLQTSLALNIYTRLNLRHGPDTDTITRHHRTRYPQYREEFDIAPTAVGHRPLGHLWLDLIFENPSAATITVSDLTLSLRPRAEC